MKALVTGGCGFLGSNIVRALLRRGDDVVVFDHRLRGKALTDYDLKAVHTIEKDILDATAVGEAARGCDAIFHCAAMVGVELYSSFPAKTMEIEEGGLRNVCAAALAANDARVIYASSSAVYGNAGGSVGLNEAQPVVPTSNYGMAKRFNELYLASQQVERKLRSLSLRIFNVYGPRQDERLVIPRFIKRAVRGEPIEIYGDGMQSRDFVYIDDVVAAALAYEGCESEAEIVNVCSGQETTVRGLANEIVRLSGSSSKIVLSPQPEKRVAFEVSRCFGERVKLRRLLAEIPATPLAEGLISTISHFISVEGSSL